MRVDSSGEKPLLLVLGGGTRADLEHVLRSVSRHNQLWLLHSEPPTWQEPYIVGSTVVDIMDAEDAVEAAQALARRIPIAGLLCHDEALFVTAARVAEALWLHVPDLAANLACSIKPRAPPEQAGSVITYQAS